MIVIEVTKEYFCGKVETNLHEFKTDKETFLFLEQLDKVKMQSLYDKLNLGVFKKHLKYIYPDNRFLSSKPLTKKQKENNTLIKKLSEAVEYKTIIKIHNEKTI